MLHNSLKTSTSLKYAMLTGIQRVAKENIFSDLNNLDVYTVIDNDYSEYFGFSIEETKELLEYYDLELNDEVKEMYDGYKMGDKEIYNPWFMQEEKYLFLIGSIRVLIQCLNKLYKKQTTILKNNMKNL